MYISLSHGFVALNNPKCASESIRYILWPHTEIRGGIDPGVPPHLTWRQAREAMAAMGHDIRDFHSFTTVRNPWDRMVSVYHFGLRSTDSIWQRVAVEGGSFTGFVDLLGKDGRPCPLNIMQFARGDDQTLVPAVFKVEEIHRLTDHLHERFGIEANLPRINASERGDYASYYDASSRERVAQLYAADIDLFGYRFADGDAAPRIG